MSKLTTRVPILITGCQRSGTTLMNLILDSHPKIWGIDEDRFDFPSIYGYLSAPIPAPFVSFKLPRYAHIMPFIEMLPAFLYFSMISFSIRGFGNFLFVIGIIGVIIMSTIFVFTENLLPSNYKQIPEIK